MTGWIKLHKKFKKWEWYDDINTKVLFLHLLLSANYKDKSWQGIVIKRGQFLTSLPLLSQQTKLSIQSIRTSITRLKSTGEITDTSTNKFRILTIVKYEEYQSGEPQETGQLTGQLTGQQHSSNIQVTGQLTPTKEYKKEKNIKKEKKERIDYGDFEEFWNHYGKIGNKQQAIKSYEKTTKEGADHEEIIAGVIRYQNYCRAINQERRFIKHASTWLNNRGWEDEYSARVTTGKSRHERAKEALGMSSKSEEINVTPADMF